MAVAGTVVPSRAVTITFTKYDSDTFSPLCGCDYPQPKLRWSGVTFPGSSFSVERRGTNPRTLYTLFSPTKAETRRIPLDQGLDVTVRILAVKRGRDYTVQQLLASDDVGAVRQIAEYGTRADLFGIDTSGELKLESHGDFSVAAAVPAPATRMDIELPAEGVPDEMRLVMKAAPRTKAEIVDVLGPSVTVVVDDPDAGFLQGTFSGPGLGSGDRTMEQTLYDFKADLGQVRKGEAPIVLLNFDRGFFALRVAAGPVPRKGSVVKGEAVDPTWLAVSDVTQERVSEGYGRLTIRIPNAAKQAETVGRTFKGAFPEFTGREAGFGEVPDVPVLKAERQWTLEQRRFRLPPAPPDDGINVFGEISRIAFDGVEGAILVGDKHLSLPATTPLELRGVEATVGRMDPVALPITATKSESRFDIRSVAQVLVNGVPQDDGASLVDQLSLENIASLATILSAVALFVMTNGRGRSRRQP